MSGNDDDPWFRAKKIELTAPVWDVVDYSPGMKPITCKWLSDKFDAQGHFDKKKARLVARGFQQPAASKKTNYAPVMNKACVCIRLESLVSEQDENVPLRVVRAGLCPLKEAQRILLKKYTKIEFGAGCLCPSIPTCQETAGSTLDPCEKKDKYVIGLNINMSERYGEYG